MALYIYGTFRSLSTLISLASSTSVSRERRAEKEVSSSVSPSPAELGGERGQAELGGDTCKMSRTRKGDPLGVDRTLHALGVLFHALETAEGKRGPIRQARLLPGVVMNAVASH